MLETRVEIDSLVGEVLLRHQGPQGIKTILAIGSLRYRIQIVDLALVSRTDEGVHRLRGSEARTSLRATTPAPSSTPTTARTTRAARACTTRATRAIGGPGCVGLVCVRPCMGGRCLRRERVHVARDGLAPGTVGWPRRLIERRPAVVRRVTRQVERVLSFVLPLLLHHRQLPLPLFLPLPTSPSIPK